MYAAFIGFSLTFILGYVFSYILKLLKRQGRELIYTDETKTIVKDDLFMPPIAKMIRKRNAVFELERSKNGINEKL